MTAERERDVERRLIRKIRAAGGECLKWVSPGRRGVPDRILLLPGAKIVFVETKSTKGRLTSNQARFHKRLRQLGFKVYTVRK